MTEPTDDTDTVPTTAPAPPTDAFRDAMLLLAIAVDPKASLERLKELQLEMSRVEKALARLAEAEKRHEDTNAKRIARALAAERAARERVAAAEAAEAQLEGEREKIAAFKRKQNARRDFGRYQEFPGGMVRELVPGQPRGDERDVDPIYGRHATPAAAEEYETERVGPSTGTLTRSVPRPRRSMRRGADA